MKVFFDFPYNGILGRGLHNYRTAYYLEKYGWKFRLFGRFWVKFKEGGLWPN